MAVCSTFITHHFADKVEAFVDNSFSHPLTMHIGGRRGGLQISVFFDEADQGYVERLARAINDAARDELPCGVAAAVAADYLYKGLER
jgi:hypothetical protein